MCHGSCSVDWSSQSSAKAWSSWLKGLPIEHYSRQVFNLGLRLVDETLTHILTGRVWFSWLLSTNLHNRDVVELWVKKLSWSSSTSPRFVAVLVGVIHPTCTMMLWSTDGFAGITRSSFFTRLSCRWCSNQAEMSERKTEIRLRQCDHQV